MKRTVILLAVFSVMAACLSGCILSTNPTTSKTITLKVGEPQTFSVSGFMNGAYTWTKKGEVVAGVTGTSYAYTALAADAGTFAIQVQTTERLTNKVVTKAWMVEVVNDLAPTANAGLSQDVLPGAMVQLDGSASSDPEAQTLTYLWEIAAKPAGSNAVLSDPYSVNPTFTADVAGVYTVRLIVNDGTTNSAPAWVNIRAYTEGSTPPTAEAGADQTVNYGTTVQLDGSASSDPEDDPLTFTWKIESQPAGSSAVLSNTASDMPTFFADKKGQYVVSLVVNDGQYDSGMDWVTITVQNTAPVANAGGDIFIDALGGTAELDGAGSSDPDGNALTYQWTITSRPFGSSVDLTNPTSETPTFVPDKKGAYIVKLVVSDGDLTDVDTVTVTVSNNVPVAEAGADITIPFGNQAQLNGSGTDPEGDPLTYAWTILQKPSGSTAALSSATIAKPTFTPDKKGKYIFQLIVTDDEGLSSAPDTVTLTTTNHAPVANAGSDINLLYPGSTTLSGSGTDQDGDTLTYAWTVTSYPSGSSGSVLSNVTSATPSFIPDVKGDYVFSLVVNDGEASSAADTVSVHVYNNAPAAVATASSVKVQKGTIVTLSGSSSSDPDGTALSYAWTITTKPSGSTAALSSTTAVSPTFTPDKDGSYTFQLLVSDGDLTATASVSIYAYTYYDGSFESGSIASPWSVSIAKSSLGANKSGYELTDDYTHGGSSYAYHPYCKSGFDNNNDTILTLTFPSSTYVYSISCWMYRVGSASSAVHSKLLVDGTLMLNGDPAPLAPHGIDSKYHILDPGQYITDQWVQRTWAVNASVSTIQFEYYDLWLVDGIYLDDIVINTWGS